VPETLSSDDLAYHLRVVGQVKQAREALAQASAAYQSWAAYLVQKYAIAGGDTIAEDGAIARAPAETE